VKHDHGKNAHGRNRDVGKRTGRLQGKAHAWSRRAGETLHRR
jgi:hypothetical protein